MFGSNHNKTAAGIMLSLALFLGGRAMRAAENAAGTILDIERRQYAFEEKSKDLITGTDGGGSLAAYYDAGVLQKIDLRVVLSNKALLYAFFYPADNSIIIERQERFQKWDEDKQSLVPGAYKAAEKTVFLLNPVDQSVNKISKDEQLEKLSAEEEKSLTQLANDAWKWAQSQELVIDVENQIKGQ